jgi:dTDP-4-dehydrorhamnose 3,5-epimerase
MERSVIDGVTVTGLKEIRDQRGAVLHMLRADSPDFNGFGECYFSEVLPGAVKAWKRHKLQTQMIAVPVGRVLMAIYDNREGSSTKGELQVIELGRPDAYFCIRIPPGVWYGFQCIAAVPTLLVNCCDLPHDPTEGESQPADFAEIPYSWYEQPQASIG